MAVPCALSTCWPGLAAKTKEICKELEVEDCNITQISKVEFRK